MSVSKPRNRLVFFRLSEDEFKTLAQLCNSTEGTRSISDLARSAVHRLIAESQSDRVTLEHLNQRIGDLNDRLATLTSLLAGCGTAPHAAAGAATANGSHVDNRKEV